MSLDEIIYAHRRNGSEWNGYPADPGRSGWHLIDTDYMGSIIPDPVLARSNPGRWWWNAPRGPWVFSLNGTKVYPDEFRWGRKYIGPADPPEAGTPDSAT